jgi:hypothetical protein
LLVAAPEEAVLVAVPKLLVVEVVLVVINLIYQVQLDLVDHLLTLLHMFLVILLVQQLSLL